MGDILHALPAVTALRKAHPGWVIDWVVEPLWRALLEADGGGNQSGTRQAVLGDTTAGAKVHTQFGPLNVRAEASTCQTNPARPVVDGLHLAPTREWRKSPLKTKTFHEISSLRRALRAGEYDAVIDLQGAVRSAVIGRMAGCPRLIGEAEPRERAAGWLFSDRLKTKGAHVIEQDLELASAVAGDDLQPAPPWLPVCPSADAWADGILGRGGSQPSVLINPGAGWGAKRWPVDRYAALAQGLIDRGLRVLVNAGPGEEPLANAVVQSAGGAIPLICTLEQLIALTRRVALAIAGDTGPLHLASALGRPVVGIYGPTDPSRNGPFGTRFKVLRSPESRRDHTRHAEPEAGLMTISPEEVLRAADELLTEETPQ